MQHAGEARFQLGPREERLAAGRAAGGIGGVSSEQHADSVQQQLRGRHAGVDREKFQNRALFECEIQFHREEVSRPGGKPQANSSNVCAVTVRQTGLSLQRICQWVALPKRDRQSL